MIPSKLKMRLFIWVVLGLCFGSCNDLTDPVQRLEISTECILIANQAAHKIYVYRSTDTDDHRFTRYDYYAPYSIDSAIVRLSTPLGIKLLPLVVDTISPSMHWVDKYFSLGLNPGIQYNGVYSVFIETPYGTITGNTRVPGDFTLHQHMTGTSVQFIDNEAAIPVHWSKSDNAYIYQVTITLFTWETRIVPGMETFTYRRDEVRSFSTTDTLFTDHVYSRLRYDSVIVAVTAFDKNFYDHKFLGNDRAGVTGGYGVIGSGVNHSFMLPIRK